MSSSPTQAKHRLSLAYGAFICGALVCMPAVAASDDAGKKKADEACAACHGHEGSKPVTAETPRLAGQQYDYLVQVLTEDHKGKRANAIRPHGEAPYRQRDPRSGVVFFRAAGSNHQTIAAIRKRAPARGTCTRPDARLRKIGRFATRRMHRAWMSSRSPS